jgi:hypothetical protein
MLTCIHGHVQEVANHGSGPASRFWDSARMSRITTTIRICRGGSKPFGAAVCPTALTQPSLQIIDL